MAVRNQLVWAGVGSLAGLAAAALPVAATEINGEALAKRNACLACHQVDSRRVGPPFREIGVRYGAGDPTAAETYLIGAIQKGVRGNWGAIPMPAQPQVSDADARRLAQWILSLPDDTP